ncbi:MAG TPA: hypothetical protein VFQ53_25675 [Kofleriaceae bacterium]|nr:hypothetical protein [Kofleriaceae bacterium]
MRAEPDGPTLLRDSTIRIVLDRLVSVEFRDPVLVMAPPPVRDELAERRRLRKRS